MTSLRDYIFEEPLFDTHEHFFGFANMDRQKDTMLYKELMESYATTAVITAHGVPMAEEINADLGRLEGFYDVFRFMREPGLDDYLFDTWPYVRTTGYGEGIELAVKECFGLEFTQANSEALTRLLRERIQQEGAREIYRALLKKARVIGVVNSAYWIPLEDKAFVEAGDYPEMVRHTVDPLLLYTMMDSSPVKEYEKRLDCSIQTLTDLDNALDAHIADLFAGGRVVGHKVGVAYMRPLDIGPFLPEEASRDFDRLMQGKSLDNNKVLSDYFLHKTIQRSQEANKPVQVHTGLLAGNYTNVTQGDPARLIPLLKTYRNCRFDLFHASWPHSRTLGALAKSFPNVWIDMCWAWTISPEAMEQALGEWLSEVPYNKIFGFGGDTSTPINTVGYALQARRGVANVLEQKVQKGFLSEASAREVASGLLWRNAENFFGFATGGQR